MDPTRRTMLQRGAGLIAILTGKGNSVADAAPAGLPPAAGAALETAAQAAETAAANMSPEVASMIAAMRQITGFLGVKPTDIEGLPQAANPLASIGDGGYQAVLAKAKASLAEGLPPPQELTDYFLERSSQYKKVSGELDGARISANDDLHLNSTISLATHLRNLVTAQERIQRHLEPGWAPTKIAVKALQDEIDKVLKDHRIPEQVWQEYMQANNAPGDVPRFFNLQLNADKIEAAVGQLWKDLGDVPDDTKSRWLGYFSMQMQKAGMRFSNGSWNQQSWDAQHLPEAMRGMIQNIHSIAYDGKIDKLDPPSFEQFAQLLQAQKEAKQAAALKASRHEVSAAQAENPQANHAQRERERREKQAREALMPDPINGRQGNDIY